jgi:hypothetical protein
LLAFFAVSILAFAVLGLGAALVWASFHRGPWYDELYSWYVTHPERGFLASLTQSWLPDNHPPLFYALTWFGRQFGGSIEWLRLLNLGVLLAALSGGWALLRRLPQYWLSAAAFVLVLVAHEAALRNGTELRSYFISYAASAVVVLALVVGWIEGGPPSKAQRWVLGVALLVGFNTHSLTSVIIGALLAPFLGLALLHGRRELVRAILVPALAAGAVFLAICAIQVPLWLGNTVNFWIPGGFNAARWSMEFAIQRTAEANPVILLGALAGIGALIHAGWRDRRLSPRLEAMVLLGAGIILACVLVMALHLMRPMVMERYLAALIPAAAMGLALGFAEVARLIPARFAGGVLLLGALATLWTLQDNASLNAGRNSWHGSAALAARVQQACPDSPIHIDPPFWNAYTMSLPPADNKAVFGASHALIAQRFGLKVEPAQSRRLSSRCPNLFWAEHDTSALWDETKILSRLRGQGFVLDRVWQYRIGDGWIAADSPLEQAMIAR